MGTSAQSAATSGTAASAAAARQQTEPDTLVGARAQAASAAAPHAAAATAVGGTSGDSAARGEGEPPSGNPKKSFLAAAGIAGAVFLVVPLLIWATDDSERKPDKVSMAAEADTVLGVESLGAPQGNYAPDKPKVVPSPEKSAERKAEVKAERKAALPTVPKAVLPTADPTVKPSPKEQKKEPAVVVARQEAPKPPPNTASYAVQQLATQNPGRHICYRVYVADVGWQGAVCDGATAGTEGQNRAITAIQISVAGTNGTAATAFIQEAGWTKPWKSAVDGTDLLIGDVGNAAPNMSGFAISVGGSKGNICQNAHVSDEGWLGLGCDTQETSNNYIFGGSLNKERWLEAVRFSV